MNAHPVEQAIKKYGSDHNRVFVFPSDIASSLWQEAALDILGTGTVPNYRFIAWDRFKEAAIQANVPDRRPVSTEIRSLYALDLAERNKADNIFTHLIPGDWKESGSVFSQWIVSILPQLAFWDSRTKGKGATREDGEDADLRRLFIDYSAFLDRHRLFEPAWQRPPLRDTGKTYSIFFMEAIEDFAEYADILRSSPFIELVPIPPAEDQAIHVFPTVRDEIRGLALSIEHLLDDGIPATDIAVSIPDPDTIEPYITREFALRSIPFEYRAGQPLGSHPAGRFFSLAGGCTASSWAFARVKALLLNRLIPWKEETLAEDLIDFGIRNHCVISWKEGDRQLDVWEEAFKAPASGRASDWRVRSWYRSLRKSLDAMTEACSFRDIRARYFAFRDEFLDMSRLSAQADAVIARCIEELTALSALETAYPDLVPQRPWSFFIATLERKKYVPQRGDAGVSIFPWRVAAGTPFPHHFIVNAGQHAASVTYRDLSFLRQDKRMSLGAGDTEVSDDFFRLYTLGPRTDRKSRAVCFSTSIKTMTGYNTPHSWFVTEIPASSDSTIPGGKAARDPFSGEREFFRGGQPFRSLYPVQSDSFSVWRERSAHTGWDWLTDAPGDAQRAAHTIRDLLQTRKMKEGRLRISQSDLKDFIYCPAYWFLSRLLRIEEERGDAELMNERHLGILYHEILASVYARIRETDGAFKSVNLDAYRRFAEEEALKAAMSHAEFRGPLAAPLITMLAGRMAGGVEKILELDAHCLDGFLPEILEGNFSVTGDRWILSGQIDRISVRQSDGVRILIDYKTAGTAKNDDYLIDEEQTDISDFQIPMYIHLAEHSADSPALNKRIEHAAFVSIRDAKFTTIVTDGTLLPASRTRVKPVERTAFESAMDSFSRAVEEFARSTGTLDFRRPEDMDLSVCAACAFNRICRSTYKVAP